MTVRKVMAALAVVALFGSSANAQVVETQTPVEPEQVANGSSSATTTSPVSVTASSPTTTTITIGTGVASNLTETVTFQPPSAVNGYSGTLGSSTGTQGAGVGGLAGSSAGGSAATSTGTSFGTTTGFGGVTASGPVYVDLPGMTPGVTP